MCTHICIYVCKYHSVKNEKMRQQHKSINYDCNCKIRRIENDKFHEKIKTKLTLKKIYSHTRIII